MARWRPAGAGARAHQQVGGDWPARSPPPAGRRGAGRPTLAPVGAGDVHPLAPDGQGQAALRQGHGAVGAAGGPQAGQRVVVEGVGGLTVGRHGEARGDDAEGPRTPPPGWSGAGRRTGRARARRSSSGPARRSGVQPAVGPPRRRAEGHEGGHAVQAEDGGHGAGLRVHRARGGGAPAAPAQPSRSGPCGPRRPPSGPYPRRMSSSRAPRLEARPVPATLVL